jgi:SAM-dependent methyltransferase
MNDPSALSFDSVAALYNDVRPGYPGEVYEFAAAHHNFHAHSKILEVGAGHGVATQEIHDFFGVEIDALEPGKNLCEILQRRFSGVPSIAVFNERFEDFLPLHRYDALFSATAYHWIDPAIKYKKAFDLLDDNGIIVLYWNNYAIADEALNSVVQEVYRKYWPDSADGSSIYEKQRKRIESRRREIGESGYFELAGSVEIPRTLAFSIDRYIRLLKTFSDHSTGEATIMDAVHADIRTVLEDHGAEVPVGILTNVEIGRKRRR